MEGAHKPVPDRPLAGLRFLLSRGPTGRRKTMAAPVVTMQNLIEDGAHSGHQTPRWNPRMKPYLFGARNGTIGRAECRERVVQYVEISVVAVSLKKKKQQ